MGITSYMIWEAEDGKQFKSKEECIKYSNKLYKIKNIDLDKYFTIYIGSSFQEISVDKFINKPLYLITGLHVKTNSWGIINYFKSQLPQEYKGLLDEIDGKGYYSRKYFITEPFFKTWNLFQLIKFLLFKAKPLKEYSIVPALHGFLCYDAEN